MCVIVVMKINVLNVKNAASHIITQRKTGVKKVNNSYVTVVLKKGWKTNG